MADDGGQPKQAGLAARLSQGMRYIVTGRTPAAWFGPSEPPAPAAPSETTGRAFDYPTGYNLAIRPREYEPITFEQMRALADGYDLLRLVIETRKDQIEKLDFTIRKRAAGIAAAGDDAGANDPRTGAISDFLRCPDGEHPWQTWLRMLLEDMLVIDAATIYPRFNRGGGLAALELIDGATVKRVLDDAGRTPAPPDPAYQQVLKGLPAVDYRRDELPCRATRDRTRPTATARSSRSS